MQAVTSTCTGVWQQDAFGNHWLSLESEGQVGWEGRGCLPGRNQILKGLVLSAKEWEFSLHTDGELLKGCKHGADILS